MEIILAHSNGDFDTIASMLAATKLYPQAQMVLQGSCERNVRDFLAEYPHNLPFKKSKHIKLEEVSKLIIVDTRQPARLGKFEKLIEAGLPTVIYDHHPSQSGDIQVKDGVVRELGATVTILLDEIKKANLPISPTEATIFALGIYEDTGCLTFATTTPDDARAVAYLLSAQADLSIVSKFLEQGLNADQVLILSDLLRNQEVHYIHGIKVLIATAVSKKYIGDLAILAHKMMDMEKLEVLFCLVTLEDKLYLISRSRTGKFNVGRILTTFDGGGHHWAASAIIKNMSQAEAKAKLLQTLRQQPVVYTLSAAPQPKDIKHLMQERLPWAIQNLLALIGEVGDSLHLSVYVVGGLVRDLLLGKTNFDVDVVVEGDGIKFAHRFSEKVGGGCEAYERFKTAVVVFPDGFRLDIATARAESYEYPGALPNVFGSDISYDLLRRDFSINAMALCLNHDRYGQLIDPLGGEKDLMRGVIRVLHENSFIDDPTRIFRAVRFETRHDFKLDEATERLITEAGKKDELFFRLANQRVRDEFILILSDDHPEKAINRLQDLGILKYVHPNMELNTQESTLFKSISQAFFELELIIGHESMERWLLYLLALIDGWQLKQAEDLMHHLCFNRLQREKVLRCKAEADNILSCLSTSKDLKKSLIFQALARVSLEALVFVVGKAQVLKDKQKAVQVKKRIILFLTSLAEVKIEIRGDDLKELGFKPGHIFKEIVNSVLMAKLDGLVKTREDELKFVQENFREF